MSAHINDFLRIGIFYGVEDGKSENLRGRTSEAKHEHC